MRRTIDDGKAIVRLGDKSIEVPIKTETIEHDDGRRDVTVHIAALSTTADKEK